MRNANAAFPSTAKPDQPIKLPRQHNVDKDEYREFLNLGHGEIFNLDLDRSVRVGVGVWLWVLCGCGCCVGVGVLWRTERGGGQAVRCKGLLQCSQ